VKIEGVFSGTMSYIFNEFSTGQPNGPSFSSVVSMAREKGYTEPHPADDLNGADVARKLTILSRYIPSLRSSLPNGYKSVSTTSLVPAKLEGIATGDEFVQRLPEFRDLNLIFGWGGLYEMTPDHNGIVDKIPNLEGLYIAAGFSGHGLMM